MGNGSLSGGTHFEHGMCLGLVTVCDITNSHSQTNVRLPLTIPEGFPTETLAAMRTEMENKLMHEWDCFAAVFVHDNKWWTRCSVQVFNEVSE